MIDLIGIVATCFMIYQLVRLIIAVNDLRKTLKNR